jgi:hypothetical protein
VKLTDLPFEDWLEHAFGPAVRPGRNAWYFDEDIDWWDPAPATAVAHFTRLFQDPEPALRYFSDEQIAQGLTYLLSTSASGDNCWFSTTSVALPDRLGCIAAIATFFAQLFAPKCTPHLSHLSDPEAGDLNRVCYMWWDEFPSIALPGDAAKPALDAVTIDTMQRILRLDSMACQESALHGLGHWHNWHQQPVAPIIDAYLASTSDLDPRLVTYARSARCGCVL